MRLAVRLNEVITVNHGWGLLSFNSQPKAYMIVMMEVNAYAFG